MADVNLHRGLGEGEVAGDEPVLPGTRNLDGEHLEQAQQGLEVDVLSQGDALGLVEVRQMGGVDLVVAKTADHPEVPARHASLGEGLGRQNRSLAAQDHPSGEIPIERVAPAQASGRPAVLVGRSHLVEIRLLDRPGVSRSLGVVDVVDVPRRVELGHEQGVAVPELGLQKRPVELLESQGRQLVLEVLEKLDVGVLASRQDPLGWKLQVVAAKHPATPAAAAQGLGSDDPDLLPGHAATLELPAQLPNLGLEAVAHVLPLDSPEQSAFGTALARQAGNQLGLDRRQLLFRKRVPIVETGQKLRNSLQTAVICPFEDDDPFVRVHTQDPLPGQGAVSRTGITVLQAKALGKLREVERPLGLEEGDDTALRGAATPILPAKLRDAVLHPLPARSLFQEVFGQEPAEGLIALTQFVAQALLHVPGGDLRARLESQKQPHFERMQGPDKAFHVHGVRFLQLSGFSRGSGPAASP